MDGFKLALVWSAWFVGDAQAFEPGRMVVFQGQQVSCQQVYDFSEDAVFAGQFQELRKSAIRWRGLAIQVQSELDRGAHLNQVNHILRELTYAVGAADTVRSVVVNGASQGVKAVVMGSLGVPDLTHLTGQLEFLNLQLANSNEKQWLQLQQQLQSQLQICLQYAADYEAQSNAVIQSLMDARTVLQQQCE